MASHGPKRECLRSWGRAPCWSFNSSIGWLASGFHELRGVHNFRGGISRLRASSLSDSPSGQVKVFRYDGAYLVGELENPPPSTSFAAMVGSCYPRRARRTTHANSCGHLMCVGVRANETLPRDTFERLGMVELQVYPNISLTTPQTLSRLPSRRVWQEANSMTNTDWQRIKLAFTPAHHL